MLITDIECNMNVYVMYSLLKWHVGCITGKEWNSDAIDSFEELTHTAKWRPIMSKTLSQRSDNSGFQMPCVHLVDTNGPNVRYISSGIFIGLQHNRDRCSLGTFKSWLKTFLSVVCTADSDLSCRHCL